MLHPAGLESYAIVAAGRVTGDGGQISPVYNGLRGDITGVEGEFVVTFDSYKQPQGEHTYIVKALAEWDAATREKISQFDIRMPIVTFDRFEETQFILFIMDPRAGPFNPEALRMLPLMIEVSQFPF